MDEKENNKKHDVIEESKLVFYSKNKKKLKL